jgi:hypothetical protein
MRQSSSTALNNTHFEEAYHVTSEIRHNDASDILAFEPQFRPELRFNFFRQN